MAKSAISELLYAVSRPAREAASARADRGPDAAALPPVGGRVRPSLAYRDVRGVKALEIAYQTRDPVHLRFRNQPGLHVHLRRRGTGRYAIDNATVINGASTEMQIYCSPHVWYKDVFEGDGLSPRNMLFGLDGDLAQRLLGTVADGIMQQSRQACYHNRLGVAPALAGQMDEFFDLGADGLDGLRRDARLYDILAASLSSLEGSVADAASRYRTRPADIARLQGVVQFIDGHLATDLSTERLAAQAGMSASRFKAAFKDFSGKPVGRYVQERRLDHATRLLAKGEGVASAAQAVGYGHTGHFARLFRDTYGMLPNEARRGAAGPATPSGEAADGSPA